nr:MAG TPA: hypothetical protein [Caudoviricetes sp.]DAV32995.1 MAG TPA: hypothetical protein [Caudoviricetes sp.]
MGLFLLIKVLQLYKINSAITFTSGPTKGEQ